VESTFSDGDYVELLEMYDDEEAFYKGLFGKLADKDSNASKLINALILSSDNPLKSAERFATVAIASFAGPNNKEVLARGWKAYRETINELIRPVKVNESGTAVAHERSAALERDVDFARQLDVVELNVKDIFNRALRDNDELRTHHHTGDVYFEGGTVDKNNGKVVFYINIDGKEKMIGEATFDTNGLDVNVPEQLLRQVMSDMGSIKLEVNSE
jgi:hypothetical protein